MEKIQKIIEEMKREKSERFELCDYETVMILSNFIKKLEKAVK
jgi:hypothetical protein